MRSARAARARAAATRASGASSRQPLYQCAEDVAALLVVVELIEARACRREEHDLSVLGDRRGVGDRMLEVTVAVVVASRGVERGCELLGRLADQMDRAHVRRQVAR